MFKGYLEYEAAGFTATPGILGEQGATPADDDTPVDLPETPDSSAVCAPSTRFEVFVDGIDPPNLSNLEASVIELAGAGIELARILEVIPEESVDAHRTIDVLVERGVLKISGAD